MCDFGLVVIIKEVKLQFELLGSAMHLIGYKNCHPALILFQKNEESSGEPRGNNAVHGIIHCTLISVRLPVFS